MPDPVQNFDGERPFQDNHQAHADNDQPPWPDGCEPTVNPSGPPENDLVTKCGQAVFCAPEGKVLGLNERYFAAAFAAHLDVLYEPDERCFYTYSPQSGLWSRQADENIRERLAAFILQFGQDRGMALASKISSNKTSAVLSMLRGIAEKRSAFARRGDRVHVGNGVIQFEGGKVTLEDFSPQHYSRNRSPVEFRADAECQRFTQQLLAAALPPDDVDLLQRWCGLTLAGTNPAQRILILDGRPATGKSTIAVLIQAVIGIQNCSSLRTDQLRERFELYRFFDKTLLTASDVAGNFLNHPSACVLKSLVGGDLLGAEGKGSNAVFTLEGNFNVIITANSRLRVRLDGDAGAWRRRLIILRFDRSPPAQRIDRLAQRLLAEEGPGILKWMLAGFVAARQEIDQTGDLALSPAQQARVDGLLNESDSLRQFVAEETEPGTGDVTVQEMLESYFRFCSCRDWSPLPTRIVENALSDIMLERHAATRRNDIQRAGKSVRGWRGIRLANLGPSGNRPSEPSEDYHED